jgi:hypothetical protein
MIPRPPLRSSFHQVPKGVESEIIGLAAFWKAEFSTDGVGLTF